MNELSGLFEEEDKIELAVREISQGILDLSDYVVAKSPIELAEAEIVGKRVRNSCDSISDEVHIARKKLGILLTGSSKVKFKKVVRFLHEMENELSLIHGDLEVIGNISENFYRVESRKVAFDNLNQHYSELVRHVTSLIVDESKIKNIL